MLLNNTKRIKMPRVMQDKQLSEQLNAQMKVFSRAIKEVHRAEKANKTKKSENYNAIHDIVSQIHKMQAFQESAKTIKAVAHNPQVRAINIVISGYDDTLVDDSLTSTKVHNMPLLNQIYKGCALWTKRNDEVARFVLSSRHHSLGSAIEHMQKYRFFDGVFAQDKRSPVAMNTKIKQYKRRCRAFGISQQYYPDLVVNMKYIMTVALIEYAKAHNTDGKPIRIHILEEDKEVAQQIIAACMDCCDKQLDKVYWLNMRYQPAATKYLGFSFNEDMPLPMEQLVQSDELEYKRDAINAYAPTNNGFTLEEMFTENLRALQQDRHAHDPLEVLLYKLDHIDQTSPRGVADEKQHIKKTLTPTTVLVNTEYVDNLFHKMEHSNPWRSQTLLEPSTDDPYHRVLHLYYSPHRADIMSSVKLYWNTRRNVVQEPDGITAPPLGQDIQEDEQIDAQAQYAEEPEIGANGQYTHYSYYDDFDDDQNKFVTFKSATRHDKRKTEQQDYDFSQTEQQDYVHRKTRHENSKIRSPQRQYA